MLSSVLTNEFGSVLTLRKRERVREKKRQKSNESSQIVTLNRLESWKNNSKLYYSKQTLGSETETVNVLRGEDHFYYDINNIIIITIIINIILIIILSTNISRVNR